MDGDDNMQNQSEFLSPFLPALTEDVTEYINKLLAYRDYSGLPVVLGEFRGFIIEVTATSTGESVLADIENRSDVIKQKQEYFDNHCQYVGHRFRSSDELDELILQLRKGERSSIFVLRGKEVEQVTRELTKHKLSFEKLETEWDAFEIRLKREED